jgi:hypothetical protein
LLGDGDKGSQIVYDEEKNILYWANWSSQDRKNISCNGTKSPTKETTKEGPLSYVLLETPIASVSTVSRGHPSLISLMLANEKLAGVINTRTKGTHEGGGGSH